MARRHHHLHVPPPLVVERVRECAPEVAAVLARVGHEAGQYHVLGPDPWFVLWSEDRRGFVAFLETRHLVFAWRSPVAPPDQVPELLAQLQRYGRTVHKPLIAVLVNDAVCTAGLALGMSPIWIGSETFHDLPSWSLGGGRRQKLRWARSHAAKLGYTWREAFPLEDPADWAALERVEQRWKHARTQRLTDSFQRTSYAELVSIRRYFLCEQPHEAGRDADTGETRASRDVVAFVACTPVNDRGWYLQDVVRLDEAPRGALEGSITLALDVLRDDGYEFASNGPLAFWRPDGEPPDPHQLGPVGRRVVNFFDGQYRFRGLAQFRSKLDPDRVEPLYVLLSSRMITPGVARSLVKVLTKRLEP